jgi:hypothetical protein
LLEKRVVSCYNHAITQGGTAHGRKQYQKIQRRKELHPVGSGRQKRETTVVHKHEHHEHITKEAAGGGIGFGAVLAMVISYVEWHSVGWAILHGALNWIYVVYFLIKYR